jgi:uncharacterized protein (UPF0548 family)
MAVQAMAHWEFHHDVKVRVGYLAGTDNWAADQLSRWRKKGLHGFHPGRECKISLSEVLVGCSPAPM